MPTPFAAENSPVFPFLNAIFDSLQNIAPEKTEELSTILQSHQVRLVVDQNQVYLFRAAVIEGRRDVRCSILGAEFLWGLACAYIAIHRQLRGMAGSELHFLDVPATRFVPSLLQFVIGERLQLGTREPIPWPSDLPRPRRPRLGEEPDDVVLATELWLCALAWILHHEVGHVHLGHLEKFEQEIQDEVLADQHATDWLLSGVADPLVKKKRSLGIAIATAALAAIALHQNARNIKLGSRTHPPAGERVLRALSHEVFGDQAHQAEELAAIAIKVHLDHFHVPTSAGPFDTVTECLHSYCRSLIDWELGRS